MAVDLQKAGIWKRIAAWMLDAILLVVLAVGMGALVALLLGYDAHSQALTDAYARYETEYGVVLNISQQEYLELTEQQRQQYDTAYNALIADEAVVYAYNMVINQTLLMISLGLLLSTLILEFVIPLWLGNGQTVGKKIFALGVIRTDGVRLTALQLFVRTLLGKFTIEIMLPVYLAIMAFFGIMGLPGTLVLAFLVLAQVILLAATANHAVIHDLLAGTVVVDIASQQIFKSTDDLIAYTKRIHAEQAARQDY